MFNVSCHVDLKGIKSNVWVPVPLFLDTCLLKESWRKHFQMRVRKTSKHLHNCKKTFKPPCFSDTIFFLKNCLSIQAQLLALRRTLPQSLHGSENGGLGHSCPGSERLHCSQREPCHQPAWRKWVTGLYLSQIRSCCAAAKQQTS